MTDQHEQHNRLTEKPSVFTYFGDSTNDLERQLVELTGRGARILHVTMAYGPTPAKAARLQSSGDSWHLLVVCDFPEGVKDNTDA